MDELAGRTAVVTGAASGIGLGLSRRLGREGMNLVLADIERAPLDEAAAELRDAGTAVLTVPCDVSDLSQIRALESASRERFGNIHVLCNNAGVGTGGQVADPDDIEVWRWTIDIDLWGVIYGCKVFLPAMIEHGEPGHVVNTASLAGLVAGPLMGAYNVAKYGVVALSETLFHELNLTGSAIGVSVLCPGFVQTAIGDSDRNMPADVAAGRPELGPDAEAFAAMISDQVAAGMSPDDVAHAVFHAISSRQFWVLTHPDLRTRILERTRGIVTGMNPELEVDPV